MKSTLLSLWHHKTIAALIVIEVAIASCLVVNALSVFLSKLGPMYWPTGIVNPTTLYLIRSEPVDAGIALGQGNYRAVDDLSAIRRASNVMAVAEVNTLPLLQEQWSVSVRSDRGAPIDTAVIAGTEGFINTLGFRLVAGRPFKLEDSDDYTLAQGQTLSHTVMVSARLAEKIWPGQAAIGKTVVYGNNSEYHSLVIGVIDRVVKPMPDTAEQNENVIFEQVRPFDDGLYAFRSSAPGEHNVFGDAAEALRRVAPNRSFALSETFEDVHRAYFEADRSLGYLLIFLIGSLMLVCWLGVGALTSFWVRQRYRSIGIRRALGATRRGIWWQFTGENLTVVSVGLLLGLPIALLTNGWLIEKYAIPPLNLFCLPIVVFVFYASCLSAIAYTLLKATAVSPMVAVRS